MASAVYQTKLTADTTQHDQSLGRSAKQVYNYKKSCDEADKGVSKLTAGFKKFVPILSAATIAGNTFKGMLNNNTEAMDNYGRIMETSKTITGEFQYALSTFDFSTFSNGLDGLIQKAKDYYDAYDNLQTLMINLSGDNAKLEAEMAKLRRRWREGDKSVADDIKRVGDEMLTNIRKEQDAVRNTLDKFIREGTYNKVSNGHHEAEYEISADIETVKGWLSDLSSLDMAIGKARQKMSELKDEADEYNKDNIIHYQAAKAEAEYNALVRLKKRFSDGDNLKEFNRLYAQMYQAEMSYDNLMARNARIFNEGGSDKTNITPKVTPKVTPIKAEDILPEGSIAEMEKKIADLKKQYELATTDEGENGRNALLEKIKEAEEELRKMKLDPADILPEGSMAQLEARLKELKLQWSLATTDENRTNLQSQIDEVQAEIDRINNIDVPVKVKTPRENIQEMIDDLRHQLELADTPELKLKIGFDIDQLTQDLERLAESLKTPSEKIQDKINEIKKKYEELGESARTCFGMMSGAVGTWAQIEQNAYEANEKNMTEAEKAEHKRTQAYLAGMQQIINAIGEAIPAILSLVAADEAEALAAGTAQAAKVKFPANLAAIATVFSSIMSVIAAISAISSSAKFAGGGIVKGNSYVGDNNIARVNAGEMILNGTQQARLFRILNGSIDPQFTGSNVGRVEFHITGDQLVGVLNNHTRRNGRVI